MWLFGSLKRTLLSFVAVAGLVALLFWLYLNIQASMYVSAQHAQVQLSEYLPTRIEVGNHLETHSMGKLNTDIHINRQLSLPLKGKYLAQLAFEVETPVSVSVDYLTTIKIDEQMPVESTTDLIYQNQLLPKFPLKMNIPIRLDVPFRLNRTYQVPIKIVFNGPVYFEFDEPINLAVKHQFKPTLNIDDPMTMRKVATFNAIMYNEVRETQANLDMHIQLPLRNIHP
ncbi:hypothetical protein ACNJ69_00985 [Acinetobacter soli]|uniref:hypothetical protein n=1 Tax=Acinetobacter soli TaxID=487316 RepID=UPI001250C87A|nr:hypothetical protein [Acinetobacter soli]MCE6006567.1 hypothetical protein [Acinetobacter soli]